MEEKITRRPGERILIWFNLVFGIFVLTQALRISALNPYPRLVHFRSLFLQSLFYRPSASCGKTVSDTPLLG